MHCWALLPEIKTKAAMPNNAFTRSSEIIKGVLNAHPNADFSRPVDKYQTI
jgi:hypothetical protein